MGVSCMNTCPGTTPTPPIGVLPSAIMNPDPLRFEIVEIKQKGNIFLVEVDYLGVTNYEGRKILLVATEMNLNQFKAMKYLDPHFSNNIIKDKKSGMQYKILARFEPSEVGKLIALGTFNEIGKYFV